MAKKKTRPTKPRPRPGYRLFLSWLLLLAIVGACSGRSREVAPLPDPVGFYVDVDGDGATDAVWTDTDGTVNIKFGAAGAAGEVMKVVGFTPGRIEVQAPDGDFQGRSDVQVSSGLDWITWMAQPPEPQPDLEVDLDGDGEMDTWLASAETQACIPWGGGCTTGGCCAPFSCMWTGVGINRKKKCCSGTSGSPFFNCQ